MQDTARPAPSPRIWERSGLPRPPPAARGAPAQPSRASRIPGRRLTPAQAERGRTRVGKGLGEALRRSRRHHSLRPQRARRATQEPRQPGKEGKRGKGEEKKKGRERGSLFSPALLVPALLARRARSSCGTAAAGSGRAAESACAPQLRGDGGRGGRGGLRRGFRGTRGPERCPAGPALRPGRAPRLVLQSPRR